MPDALSLDRLREAVTGAATALRAVTPYQPAGGEGDKVFPPTYVLGSEGGRYATEKRRLPGEPEPVDCVLLDSVQSQANRMELALLEAHRDGRLALPVVSVRFAGDELAAPFTVTSLEAPHRIADALLRDSLLDGTPFRQSEPGRRLDQVATHRATALFELCPTALVFGLWDSTGPRGGLGAKFARAVVSEVVGLHAVTGRRTSSRIDPAQILLAAGPLYRAAAGESAVGWTLDEEAAETSKGKPVALGKTGRPSEANHGNVTPTIADGGVTISSARQTTVLSLPSLRRLRFPLDGEERSERERDRAAHTALAALALAAAALTREGGLDLRSRCQLHPAEPVAWELLDRPGEEPERFELPAEEALSIARDAIAAARDADLPWLDEELVLEPSPQLLELVVKSQRLAAEQGGEAAEAS